MANTQGFARTYDVSKPPTSPLARPHPTAMTNPPVGTSPDPARMANFPVSTFPDRARMANRSVGAFPHLGCLANRRVSACPKPLRWATLDVQGRPMPELRRASTSRSICSRVL